MTKILETERLLLRRLEPGDLDALARLYADPEVRRYYPEGTLDCAQTKDELDWFVAGDPDHPDLGLWATILKAEDRFIGRCGLIPWTIDGVAEVEVAYLIDKAYWGRGLGAEAARGLVRHAVDNLGLARLIAQIDPANEASARTARAAGLAFERTATVEGSSFALYAVGRAAP
ncbi:MAG: GNAT family N-acetyltransferase [Alphaproteobacteria bacterium]|nr:GNAT family N-acetyltransferase [Alphaproteobacteria bacterium]